MKPKFDVALFISRLKQPHVLIFLATLCYQVLEQLGFGIDQQTFQSAVDIVTYVFFGITVYKSDKNTLI